MGCHEVGQEEPIEAGPCIGLGSLIFRRSLGPTFHSTRSPGGKRRTQTLSENQARGRWVDG